jgi:hypothetical protein
LTTAEPTLRDQVETLVAETAAGAERAETGSTIAWSVGGRPFAALTNDAIELRLDAPIAAAAVRTPDTAPSPRGPEWVRFAPRDLDDHAIDRLEAWFGLAYRRAGE